jgi:HK97 family phage major capsid protein
MAYVERDDATALIPEEVSSDIVRNLPESSVALSRFRRVNMSRKQHRMPVLSALPTAYFVDGDIGLKQTTKVAWANKFLTAEELAVIVPVPEAVLDDSEFDIWNEVQPLVTEAIGMAIDAAVFFGTNKPASWPTAVVPQAAAAGNVLVRSSVQGQDLAGDISGVMGLVEGDGYDVNGFLAKMAMKADLRNLRDGNEGLLYQPNLPGGTPNTLYGEPINYIRNDAWDADEADLIAGDFSQAILGVRQDITFKVLDQATIQDGSGDILYNLAQQDMIALRVVMRVAFQVANPINRANTNSNTRYPFAALQPAGYGD